MYGVIGNESSLLLSESVWFSSGTDVLLLNQLVFFSKYQVLAHNWRMKDRKERERERPSGRESKPLE